MLCRDERWTHAHTHSTHTQVDLSLETKHFFRPLLHNNGSTVAPKKKKKKPLYIQCQCFRMSASRLQCETVVSEGQITWYFLALRLQHHKKDTESYYYASALPLSLSLTFIPLPSLPVMIPVCLVAHVVHLKMAAICGRNRMLSQRYRANGFLCHAVSKHSPSLFTFN